MASNSNGFPIYPDGTIKHTIGLHWKNGKITPKFINGIVASDITGFVKSDVNGVLGTGTLKVHVPEPTLDKIRDGCKWYGTDTSKEVQSLFDKLYRSTLKSRFQETLPQHSILLQWKDGKILPKFDDDGVIISNEEGHFGNLTVQVSKELFIEIRDNYHIEEGQNILKKLYEETIQSRAETTH